MRWKKTHDLQIKLIEERRNHKNQIFRARIHGYLCGDGSVSIRKENACSKVHHEMFFYPDDVRMLSSFLEAFESIYGKKPSIRKFKKYFRVSISSKPIALDLLSDGPFSSKSWFIPKWVSANVVYAKEWISAFFDSEAYVGANSIRIQSVNQKGLEQIQILLLSFGIESKIYSYKRKNPNWSINYHLSIQKRQARNEFINRIGFNHSRKIAKCQGRIIR